MIHDMRYVVQGTMRQERRFDVLANHLANVGTAGFKGNVLSFDSMLRARMTVDMSQGVLQSTGNPLDLAISGDGFFRIQTDQGVRYTRNGSFTLDADGTLVNSDGQAVLGENGPLILDGADITINDIGEVEVDGTVAGRLRIVDFVARDRLEKEGNSLLVYRGPETDAAAPQRYRVTQGAVEQANIETVAEMTHMVETSRFYESLQKLMQTIDEMNAKAISDVGQVR